MQQDSQAIRSNCSPQLAQKSLTTPQRLTPHPVVFSNAAQQPSVLDSVGSNDCAIAGLIEASAARPCLIGVSPLGCRRTVSEERQNTGFSASSSFQPHRSLVRLSFHFCVPRNCRLDPNPSSLARDFLTCLFTATPAFVYRFSPGTRKVEPAATPV